MRALITFLTVMAVGALVAQLAKAISPTFGAGYTTGVSVMLAAALVLNTRAANRS